jgi:hypothetical protein
MHLNAIAPKLAGRKIEIENAEAHAPGFGHSGEVRLIVACP